MSDAKKDTGADPMPDGMFRMYPSGDIVDLAERNKRLPVKAQPEPDCLGMTWQQIAMKQGGLNTLDITRNK